RVLEEVGNLLCGENGGQGQMPAPLCQVEEEGNPCRETGQEPGFVQQKPGAAPLLLVFDRFGDAELRNDVDAKGDQGLRKVTGVENDKGTVHVKLRLPVG